MMYMVKFSCLCSPCISMKDLQWKTGLTPKNGSLVCSIGSKGSSMSQTPGYGNSETWLFHIATPPYSTGQAVARRSKSRNGAKIKSWAPRHHNCYGEEKEPCKLCTVPKRKSTNRRW